MPLQHQQIQGSGEVVRISRDVTASAQCTALRGSCKHPQLWLCGSTRAGVHVVGLGGHRGADALVSSGRIGAAMAAALKAEARRRVASGEYFGHIAYMSCVAHKPLKR